MKMRRMRGSFALARGSAAVARTICSRRRRVDDDRFIGYPAVLIGSPGLESGGFSKFPWSQVFAFALAYARHQRGEACVVVQGVKGGVVFQEGDVGRTVDEGAFQPEE